MQHITMEHWRIEVSLLETGVVSIRNAPVYKPVPTSHWAEEYCMICRKLLKHQYYVGYAFQHTHQPNSIVRMMGAGMFCRTCEQHSRAIVQVLKEWEVIVTNKEQWEEAISRLGTIRAEQVHVCRQSTEGYGANPPFIPAVFDCFDHIKVVEGYYGSAAWKETINDGTPPCTPDHSGV